MNLPLVTSCVLKNNLVDNLEVVEGEFEEKIKDMDVTLACDDDYIRVHKIIQISCSELFHIVFPQQPNPQVRKTHRDE